MRSFYQYRNNNYTFQKSIDNSYPAHLHKQVELIYIMTGNMVITIDDMEYNASAGDILICFPNLVHATHTPVSSTALFFIFDVGFVNDYSNELLKMHPAAPLIKKDCVSNDVISCIRSLEKHAMSGIDSRIEIGYFYIILGELLPYMELKESPSLGELNSCQQILIYIDNHFTDDITLESLSSSLNMSKYYISHIFSSKIKTSFPTYLNSKRVDYARHLIRTTTLSITEISYSVGFNSSRTFYRSFKANYGISPLEYRNSQFVQIS